MIALSSIVRDPNARIYYCTSHWLLTEKQGHLVGDLCVIIYVWKELEDRLKNKSRIELK